MFNKVLTVVSCNTSESIYFINTVEENVAEENLRDQFVHEIFQGECYLKGFYLQNSRSKTLILKSFLSPTMVCI